MGSFRLPVVLSFTSLLAVAVMVFGSSATVATAQPRDLGQQTPFRDDGFRVGMPFEVTLCHIPPGNPSSAHTIQVA